VAWCWGYFFVSFGRDVTQALQRKYSIEYNFSFLSATKLLIVTFCHQNYLYCIVNKKGDYPIARIFIDQKDDKIMTF
jgi:hypothetical protein